MASCKHQGHRTDTTVLLVVVLTCIHSIDITFEVAHYNNNNNNNKLLYSHISKKHIDSTTVKHKQLN